MAASLFYLLFISTIFLILPILVGVFVYRDAQHRGMNAVLWALIAVLAPALTGLIIYLVVRMDVSTVGCPQCQTPISPNYSLCPQCGYALKGRCENCGRTVESNWRLCPDCGKSLNPVDVPSFESFPEKREKGLGRILIAVLVIPVIIVVLLAAGLISYRSSFTNSITSMDDLRPEDYQNNKTVSQWLDDCDARGNGLYVLEYEKKLAGEGNEVGYETTYLIYRKGNLNISSVSSEGVSRSLFQGTKLLVRYTDDQSAPMATEHLFQITYYTTKKPALNIEINGRNPEYIKTTTNQPIPFASPTPWRSTASQLFDAQILYIGDASGVSNLLRQTDLPAFGDFTMELKTMEEPYGLRVIYETLPDADDAFFQQNGMLLLGLVQNLGYIEIPYEGGIYTLSKEQASQILGFDVKELGQSQILLEEYLEKTMGGSS